MKQFKMLIKEIQPIRGIITIITVFIFDGFIVDSLYKIGYMQWLCELVYNTLTVYEDLAFLNFLRVMGMDILGVISCFAILHLMFYVYPNVMGLNKMKAGDIDA